MKVLVVGSGPVGLSALFGLKNNKSDMKVFLSEQNNNSKHEKRIFNIPTIYSFSGRGGLGRFWHNVLDITYVQKNHPVSSIADVLKYFWSVDLLEVDQDLKKLTSNTGIEIVPRTPLRPQQRIELFDNLFVMPAVNKINPNPKSIEVVFDDNSKQCFDRIILCAGVFGTANILLRSGLAKDNKTIGDHIVLIKNSILGEHNKKPELKITSRRKNFLSRSYFKNDNNKIMLRPSFARAKKNSIIYSQGTFNTVLDIIKKADFGTILESANLRYGYPASGSTYKTVVQVSSPYAYFKNNKENESFEINQEEINEIIASFECESSIDDFDIHSGIHFFNVAKSISKETVSMPKQSTNIAVFSPSLEVEMPSNHFTFSIMLSAFEYAKNMTN